MLIKVIKDKENDTLIQLKVLWCSSVQLVLVMGVDYLWWVLGSGLGPLTLGQVIVGWMMDFKFLGLTS